MKNYNHLIMLVLVLLLHGCNNNTNSLVVTATAYTSKPNETDSTPSLTAWGDMLKPEVKSIAVSRDLIEMGLYHGVEVSIDGLEGKYKVLDKMNKRWKQRIDIYMGKDVKRAKKWGKRKVVIYWKKGPSQS